MSNNKYKMTLYSEIMDDCTIRTFVHSPAWVRIEHKKRKNVDIVYTIYYGDNKLTDFGAACVLEFSQRVSDKALEQKIQRSGNKRLIEIREIHKRYTQKIKVQSNVLKKEVWVTLSSENSADATEDVGFQEILCEAIKHFTYLATFFAKNPSELWEMREYVYKCLDNYFDNMKQIRQKNVIEPFFKRNHVKIGNNLNPEDYDSICIEDGIVCGALSDSEDYDFKIALGKDIFKHFESEKTRNIDRIVLTYIHIFINEYTIDETAKQIGISERQCKTIVSKIKKVMKDMPAIKEMYNEYYG